MNECGVTAKTMITESKRDLILLLLKQREKLLSTTVAQVITVITVKTWRWYDFGIMLRLHMDVVSMWYRHRMFTENSKAVLKIIKFVS